MTGRSLRSNFTWTLAGNVVFALSQWVTLIAITKLGSARAVGDWTLALAITAPVFIFAQLKLRTVQISDVRHENRWGEYLALRLLGSVAALAVVAAIVVVGYRDDAAAVILMIAVAKALDGVSDLVYGLEQHHERMERIARSQVVRGLSAATCGVIVVWWTRSASWAAAATAASHAAWVGWDLLRARDLVEGGSLAPRWSRAPLTALFHKVLPLGFVTAIGSLQVNIPRYFLDGYRSREEVGVFGTLAYLLVFGNMIVAAVATAALPRLSRLVVAGDWSEFRRLISRLLGIGLVLGICAVATALVAGHEILRAVYSEAIARHDDVLVWLCATSGLIWSYVFLGTALDAMRRFRVQPLIHLISSAIIAVASFALVPSYGMKGATWAMLVGYAAEAMMYLAAVAIPLRQERSAT